MLDQAFDALKSYDWGADVNALNPINEAVVATQKDPAARADLEKRLLAVLDSNASRDAKDYVCRKLLVAGSAACVSQLAALLPNEQLSHMARYVLERLAAPEAGAALRESLGKVNGAQKIGVIGSLGNRKESESVAPLAALLNDPDAAVARAAALALGCIRNAEAAKALGEAKQASPAVVDARLACAEGLLAAGSKGEALSLYKSLAGDGQPKHVRLAATRGMLACAGK